MMSKEQILQMFFATAAEYTARYNSGNEPEENFDYLTRDLSVLVKILGEDIPEEY